MPFFDYQCENCGHKWEWLGSYNERPAQCPNCNAYKIVRLPSINTKPVYKEGNVYDQLEKGLPGVSIKSFANDKRKGGKDTT